MTVEEMLAATQSLDLKVDDVASYVALGDKFAIYNSEAGCRVFEGTYDELPEQMKEIELAMIRTTEKGLLVFVVQGD